MPIFVPEPGFREAGFGSAVQPMLKSAELFWLERAHF
jgi:hypothetical protein